MWWKAIGLLSFDNLWNGGDGEFGRRIKKLEDVVVDGVKKRSYQILLNGNPSRRFCPQRGLRQGDPLSPYLFILCADILSGLFRKAALSKDIHGIKVARNAPTISHLFFADDSLLFSRANEAEAIRVLSILQKYQRASGQLVNVEKSEVSFSGNMGNVAKEAITSFLGFKSVSSHIKYLGLPIVFGRSKKAVFSLVVDRVWKKLKGWKEGFLSKAGKEVLIKAVAQAIPTYIMSCYKLPDCVCAEIESMLASFWWGAKNGEKKIHWMRWEKLAIAKGDGGMGFRGIRDFNVSLLGKQFWRLLKGDGTLMERFFKGRYYPNCNVAEAGLGFSPSYAWRSILSAKDFVMKGSRWRIGDGEKVRIWEDNWIPSLAGFKPIIRPLASSSVSLVSSLIDKEVGCWDLDKVKEVIGDVEAAHVIGIPLSAELGEDTLIWNAEKDGEFSVKTAYHQLCSSRRKNSPSASVSVLDSLWKPLWKTSVPNKIKEFLWRLVKDILPTRSNICKKGINIDSSCPLCGCSPENSSHLFIHCDFVKRMFFAGPLGVRVPEIGDVGDWLLQVFRRKDPNLEQVICFGLWKVWQARNALVFRNSVPNPSLIAQEVNSEVLEFNACVRLDATVLRPLQVESSFGNSWIIQTDAGCFEEGFVVLGCVIRDPLGEVVMVATNRLPCVAPPNVAEGFGIRWALNLAKDAGLENIMLLSDALEVVDCINGVCCVAILEPIVVDCQTLFKCFHSVSVMFVGRNNVADAHKLVGLGRQIGSQSWLGFIPHDEECSVSLAHLAVS
ncbi:uncharacterized protein LOC131622856 [Vicia villosa]|uniref:uncharacterized protein LOC131622856 n=1 Tax=Vicia villosa TaxID=3911 RepID=UPI00273C144B|nr:uncharacterized protein LOC131622856 [Vicia villosa]